MKLIFSIIGFAFVIISLVLALTNYGKTIDDTYDKCSICIKSEISYNCDCVKMTYSQNKSD